MIFHGQRDFPARPSMNCETGLCWMIRQYFSDLPYPGRTSVKGTENSRYDE
jgi:hypothetical protein